MNRQEDLMKVVDRTWSANHDNGVKKAREREKKFIAKMFNAEEKKHDRNKMTPEKQANKLREEINNVTSFQRQKQISNIVKKWK